MWSGRFKGEEAKEGWEMGKKNGCTITDGYFYPADDGSGRILYIKSAKPWTPEVRHRRIYAKRTDGVTKSDVTGVS